MFLTAWYFKKNGKWPQTQADLEQLIIDNDVPINLSSYGNITFQETDKDIIIKFSNALNTASIPHQWTIAKEELMNFEPISFEDNDEGELIIPKAGEV